MSHSERNLSRLPKAKRRRLTFAVTISAPTGMTLPQWQAFVQTALVTKLQTEHSADAALDVVVKLLKTTTDYEAHDEQ
jgi:hypothetical protein